MEQDRHPGGRPSKYQAAYARQAGKLCWLGATDRDLAESFEVATTTIWRWQVQHEGFCNALRVGKSVADERVVRSLYQRAVGYSFDSLSWQSSLQSSAPASRSCLPHQRTERGTIMSMADRFRMVAVHLSESLRLVPRYPRPDGSLPKGS